MSLSAYDFQQLGKMADLTKALMWKLLAFLQFPYHMVWNVYRPGSCGKCGGNV